MTRSGFNSDHHDKTCLNVPFFHAFGMVMGIAGHLHYGSTMVLASASFNPTRSIDAIKAEKCSATYGTPTMWVGLNDGYTFYFLRVHKKMIRFTDQHDRCSNQEAGQDWYSESRRYRGRSCISRFVQKDQRVAKLGKHEGIKKRIGKLKKKFFFSKTVWNFRWFMDWRRRQPLLRKVCLVSPENSLWIRLDTCRNTWK